MQVLFFAGSPLRLILLLCSLLWLGMSSIANGHAAPLATLTVNSTDETINPTDGKCTLREAIHAANTDTASGAVAGECPAGNGADTIELSSAAIYILTLVDNTDATLGENGLPVITSDIIFNGNDATIQRSTTNGIPNFRLLQIVPSGIVELNHLTLEFGNASYGGAIANQGSLVINASIFLDNVALNGGGAIWSNGLLNLTASRFAENQTLANATHGGGAVEALNYAVIRDTAFEQNTARVFGGALFSNGSISVERCTFLENSVAGNNSIGGGGAIYGSANVRNSTFYQNHAGIDANGSAAFGIGIFINSTFADNPDSDVNLAPALIGVTLKNSILLRTRCMNVTDGGGNLHSPRAHNQCPGSTGDPQLGPLQDNGGATLTMLPAPGSPALNAAVKNDCPSIDQRGITRPQGATCDIGAVELEPPTPPTLLAPSDGKHLNRVRVNLKWQGGERLAAYMVFVRQDSPSGKRVFHATLTANSARTMPLERGHLYYWRVYSYSNVARAPSDWQTFFVE